MRKLRNVFLAVAAVGLFCVLPFVMDARAGGGGGRTRSSRSYSRTRSHRVTHRSGRYRHHSRGDELPLPLVIGIVAAVGVYSLVRRIRR